MAKANPSPAKKSKPRKEHSKVESKKLNDADVARMEHIHALLDKRLNLGNAFEHKDTYAYSVSQLCKEVNQHLLGRYTPCSDKTIRRTLEKMQDYGMPLHYDRGQNSWRYTRKTQLPMDRINMDFVMKQKDALGILLSRRALIQFEGTPLHAPMSAFFDQLVARLPPQVRARYEALVGHIRFPGPKNVKPIPESVWRDIGSAIDSRCTLRITYRTGKTGQTSIREVAPYALLILDRKWHLLGHDHQSGQPRAFHVLRMVETDVTDNRFEVPVNFNLDAYLGDTVLGYPTTGPKKKVRLRFTKEGTDAGMETVWHPKEARSMDDQGRLTVAFETSATFMVAREVLAWGGLIEVLEPADLRGEVRTSALRASEVHAANEA